MLYIVQNLSDPVAEDTAASTSATARAAKSQTEVRGQPEGDTRAQRNATSEQLHTTSASPLDGLSPVSCSEPRCRLRPVALPRSAAPQLPLCTEPQPARSTRQPQGRTDSQHRADQKLQSRPRRALERLRASSHAVGRGGLHGHGGGAPLLGRLGLVNGMIVHM